ncbi:MAG: DUF2169 domain-containing protein [Deltaproteobacteria bacterium]|nr:DUF2169 domain-containing protein [Deltaproteobacteria bacterium]
MRVASFCQLPVGIVVWSSPARSLTAIVKATYDLGQEGEAPLSKDQRALVADDPASAASRSHPSQPSDFAPWKGGADLLVVGHAHGSSDDGPIALRLQIGDFSKTCYAMGDGDGTAVPLEPAQLRAEPTEPEPTELGPIAADVPGWMSRCVTQGFDFNKFNVAPADQRVGWLAPGIGITLEGFLEGAPRRSVTLPAAQPTVFLVSTGEVEPHWEPVSMVCDTLWIDTDAAICTVTWRGVVGLRRPLDKAYLAVAHGPERVAATTLHGQLNAAAWTNAVSEIQRSDEPSRAPADDQSERTMALGDGVDEAPLPGSGSDKPRAALLGSATLALGDGTDLRAALPFLSSGQAFLSSGQAFLSSGQEAPPATDESAKPSQPPEDPDPDDDDDDEDGPATPTAGVMLGGGQLGALGGSTLSSGNAPKEALPFDPTEGEGPVRPVPDDDALPFGKDLADEDTVSALEEDGPPTTKAAKAADGPESTTLQTSLEKIMSQDDALPFSESAADVIPPHWLAAFSELDGQVKPGATIASVPQDSEREAPVLPFEGEGQPSSPARSARPLPPPPAAFPPAPAGPPPPGPPLCRACQRPIPRVLRYRSPTRPRQPRHRPHHRCRSQRPPRHPSWTTTPQGTG